MAARKKRSTPKNATKSRARSGSIAKSGFSFGHLAFGCLIMAAIAGWYYAPLLKQTSTARLNHANSHRTNTVPAKKQTTTTPKPAKKPNDATHVAIAIPRTAAPVVPRPPIPPAAVRPALPPKPQQKRVTAAHTPHQSLQPVAPHRAVSAQPPDGRIDSHNAAKTIYARRAMIIFTDKNERARTVTTVAKGQEMRSYEQQGNWHRIVVPTTNIIGWAKAEDVTTHTPFFKAFSG